MNSTSPQSLRVPVDGLGPFQPLYSTVIAIFEDLLGLNTAFLFNVFVTVAAAATFLQYASSTIYRYAHHLFLSSVHLNDDDELYQYLMRWMSDHKLSTRSFRNVKATIPPKTGWEEEDTVTQLDGADELNADNFISYRAALGRSPIRLHPFEGSHIFRHRGHWIYFSHRVHKSQPLFQDPRERGFIHLEVLGRSLAPLEALLRDAQLYHLAKSSSTTHVYRAIASRGDTMRWSRVVSRPARDIRTVVLERGVKRRLLRDINEYLHPRTRRWYANRGLPYRRGFLFSGAPGSGKTSLTVALAGVFGLDIYVLSLLDPLLTEGQLMRLFSEIPTRCIVLLEDVDVAGLGKRSNTSGQPLRSPAAPSAQAQGALSPTSGGFGVESKPASTSGVSLSALLNAIDGVASSEGRVLIMTTNSPESLDRALVRPGRVDMHVPFELPGREEVEALFVSIYYDPDTHRLVNGEHSPQSATEGSEKGARGLSELEFVPSSELRTAARRFAEAVPEKQLSLAAIQGFLLTFKGDLEGACQNVGTWSRDMIREQEEEMTVRRVGERRD